MGNKQTYWITTVNGVHAQVDGVDERDRWTPLGWQETDEPSPTDFVYMRKDGIEQPGQFAYGAAETWRQMGWEYCGPPDPVDVTKDPQLFAQPEPQKRPASSKTTTTDEPAAGADKNTKE